nr:MAG TPA: transposon-encoded protein [Caudoviricetes sp.]
MLIGKTQRWVVNELRKAGYKRMDPPYLSAIINGHYHTEYTETVLDKIEEIIKPYEN